MTFAKISVIIPTRNRADLLPATLDCFINQSLKPYEIIVVDNGSTDNTEQVIRDNYKNQVIYIKNQSGSHTPGSGRNLGLKVVAGKYVKFFDSDDLVTKNHLEAQAKLIKKSGADAVCSPYVMFYVDDKGDFVRSGPVLQTKKFVSDENLVLHMSKGFFYPLPAFLFRADFLKDIGYQRADLYAYEDFDYLFRMALTGFVPVHDKSSCVFYRIHQNQITGRQRTNQSRDSDKLLCITNLVSKYSDFLSSNEILNFKSMLSKTPGFTADFGWSVAFNSFLLRMKNKINRLSTHTDWQKIHSPENSDQLFKFYLQKL